MLKKICLKQLFSFMSIFPSNFFNEYKSVMEFCKPRANNERIWQFVLCLKATINSHSSFPLSLFWASLSVISELTCFFTITKKYIIYGWITWGWLLTSSSSSIIFCNSSSGMTITGSSKSSDLRGLVGTNISSSSSSLSWLTNISSGSSTIR